MLSVEHRAFLDDARFGELHLLNAQLKARLALDKPEQHAVSDHLLLRESVIA